MPDSAPTPSSDGAVLAVRKPKRHFDLAETDAAASAAARSDAPSVIRTATKPATAVSAAAPVTPAVVARKSVTMIPLVAASAASASPSDSSSAAASDAAGSTAAGGCCGGGCCS